MTTDLCRFNKRWGITGVSALTAPEQAHLHILIAACKQCVHTEGNAGRPNDVAKLERRLEVQVYTCHLHVMATNT